MGGHGKLMSDERTISPDLLKRMKVLIVDPNAFMRGVVAAFLLALPAADLSRGIRVRVQGTVTLCDFGAVIQDGRHALWVVGIGMDRDEAGRMLFAGRDGARQPIGLGSRLEVVGVVDENHTAVQLRD